MVDRDRSVLVAVQGSQQVSDKVRQLITAFQDLSPAEAASYILTQRKGDPRAAEVDAWDLYHHVAGGRWGHRTNKDNAMIAYAIAWHIIDRTEVPYVPRTAVQHPAYAVGRRLIMESSKPAPTPKRPFLGSLVGR